jgi:hypothetical protein
VALKKPLWKRRLVMLFVGQDVFHWENCYYKDWSAIVSVGTMNGIAIQMNCKEATKSMLVVKV